MSARSELLTGGAFPVHAETRADRSVKLRLALSTVLMLLPLAGAAQELPSLVPQPGSTSMPLVEQLLALDGVGAATSGEATPVLPIWSGANGQLLAVVALPRDWIAMAGAPTPAYAGPSAWQLVGGEGAGSGLEWRFGHGARLEAQFGGYDFSTHGLGAAPGSLPGPLTLTGLLGFGWTSPDAGFDLSYGLSWLKAQDANALVPTAWAASPVAMRQLPLAAAGGQRVDGEAAFYVRGKWKLDQGAAFDLGASYGRSHLGVPGLFNSLAPGLDLDQLSLTLGLDIGSLRGAIVGRVTRSDDPALAGRRWTALDLGISWRTPWSGELSLGAQNLWSTPAKSPREAEIQGRTPYIQYRQDL